MLVRWPRSTVTSLRAVADEKTRLKRKNEKKRMRREERREKREEEEEGMAGQKAQAAGGFSAFLIASARQHYGCHAMGGDLRQ